MKNTIKLFAILTFVVAIFAFSCTNSESTKTVTNSNANSTQSVDKQTYKSVGVIKKIDAENGKLTVDHEDIPGYMSPMEMTEPVKDRAMLETVKAGDKVEFEIERTGSKIVFTKLTKTGEVAVLNGAEIYKTNCATCHGEKGEGAKKGISLITGHALDHSEEDFVKTVTNGKSEGKENKIPSFKEKLTAEQINEVVKFVRTEIQKDAVKDGKKKENHHHSH